MVNDMARYGSTSRMSGKAHAAKSYLMPSSPSSRRLALHHRGTAQDRNIEYPPLGDKHPPMHGPCAPSPPYISQPPTS